MVLLASHGPDGAFGWIVNGRAIMPLSELLVRAEIKKEPPDIEGVVRLGGPVSPEQVWLVYKVEHRFDGIEGQFPIGPFILATPSRKVLEAIGEGGTPASVMALAGCAGWGPMQLEEEIRKGAWLPTEADVGVVFDVPREKAWEQAFALVGASPMASTFRTVGLA